MRVGYARVSTLDQVAGIEAQQRDLDAAGCERVYREQASSVRVRPQLEAALDFIRDGDVLTVTKIDRLARSISDLVAIIARCRGKGAELHILELGSTDPNSPVGEFMVNTLGVVAQFERRIMLERQREGIAKAKSEGKYRGRQPTARRQAGRVHALAQQGHGPAAITRMLQAEGSRISERSVYRILSQGKGQSLAARVPAG
jgi:DNA invertase Pin-like site-specific DNA recombinase